MNHSDYSREELLEAFDKLSHSKYWNNAIKTALIMAFCLIALVALTVTNVQL